jgi:hypothetical protein
MIRRIPVSVEAPAAKKTFQKNNFADMMVNLSVKDKSSVTRKIRLIGVPCPIIEYTDKKYHPSERGKTVRVPFPDAHLNRSFNRTGHSDPSQCAWAQMGYIPTVQYVQNVLEKTEDGEWVVKILKKGKSIFGEFKVWEDGRRLEEDLDEDEAVFSGVRNSHCFRIQAIATGKEPPQSVEYRVTADSKPTVLTDSMIELLRKTGEPSPDDLAQIRANYEEDAKDYLMPEWEDYFAYGYPLDKIFKYQAPRTEDNEVAVVAPVKPMYEDVDAEPDIEPVKPVKAAAKKPSKPVFEDDEDNDDEDDLPFL